MALARAPQRPRSLLAQIRAWFGCSQRELADYLGLLLTTYYNLEIGRRALAAGPTLRLLPLLRLLPPPPPPGPGPHGPPPAPRPPPPPPGAGGTAGLPPADRAPLARRLAICRHTAARLRREAATYARQAQHAARRAAALPALRAAADAAGPDSAADPAAAAAAHAWLAALPPALPPARLSAWYLAHARADALDAEAATLAALLAA